MQRTRSIDPHEPAPPARRLAALQPRRRTPFLLLLLGTVLIAGCGVPRWPMRAPLTSPYGIRTLGNRLDMHHGVDLGVPTGTPVNAMAAGVVSVAGPKSGYGLAVMIDHGGGWVTLYGHLESVAVAVGDRVRAGALLGLSGNTGISTAPHLHFEVRHFGRSRDPVPLLGGMPSR